MTRCGRVVYRFLHLFLSIGFVLAMAATASAQTDPSSPPKRSVDGAPMRRIEYPLFEGFLGASVSNNDYGGQRYTMPGWHISFAVNPRHNLRLVADFAGQYRHTNIQPATSTYKVRLEEDQLLWGPEFTFRKSRQATPFVHALFGVAGRHYYTPSGDLEFPRDVLEVDYGFATAFGGGADVALSRRWALRAVQFDYVLTHLSHDQPQFSGIPLPTLAAWQHNYRLGFGVVVRLGTRSLRR